MSRAKQQEAELDHWTRMTKNPKGFQETLSENKTYLHDFRAVYNIPSSVNVAVDLGCGGFGGMVNVYEAKDWILVDPLNNAFEALVSRDPRWTYVSEPAEKISAIDDGEAQMVFSCNAAEHGEIFSGVVKEAYRILCPGGYFCLWVHCYRKDQLDNCHRMSLTSAQIIETMNNAGFNVRGYIVKNMGYANKKDDRIQFVAVGTK